MCWGLLVYLENRFEPNTLLANVPFPVVLYLLGAACDATDRSDIVLREPSLVAAYPETTTLAIEER